MSSIFRSSLFRLRKALFAEMVLFDGEVYRLNPHISYTYDVQSFEQACTSAEFGDNPTQKAYHYRRAIDTYHGSFLPDLYGDWITHIREALQARHLQALVFLATFSLGNHNYPQAITFARQILSIDEHHEAAYHVLIQAYVRSGQRPRAKQIFDTYQSMLREFGLKPQRDWQDLSTQ
jgi:two-component SAPR family response regulator